jgi:hypothetical protein
LIAGIIFGGQYIKQKSSPIPKTILQAVNYPIYYPSSLPSGYQLDKTSVTFQSNILSYKLVNNNKNITITEQASPSPPPDLQLLIKAGYSKVETPLGLSVLGTHNGITVATLLTSTTLINLTADKGVPSDYAVKTIQQLHSLPN